MDSVWGLLINVAKAYSSCSKPERVVGAHEIIEPQGNTLAKYPLHENNAECPVCLGPLEDACQTHCNHTFCFDCLYKALWMQEPFWTGTCPLCRASVDWCQIHEVATGSLLAYRDVETIFGHAYVTKTNLLGVESIHFESEKDCYVSFENAHAYLPEFYPSDLPQKKKLVNTSWDPVSRTFHGTLEWECQSDSILGKWAIYSDSTWHYTLQFSFDFGSVAHGKIASSNGQQEPLFETLIVPIWATAATATDTVVISYNRFVEMPLTPLGSVYVPGEVYDWGSDENAPKFHFKKEGCYLIWDGAKVQLDSCSFDQPSRTFRGKIPREQGASTDVRFVFSECFNHTIRAELVDYDQKGIFVNMEVTEKDPTTLRGTGHVRRPRFVDGPRTGQALLRLLSKRGIIAKHEGV